MRLETERLIIRPVEARDHEQLIKINADPVNMRYFEAPHTPEETIARIKRSHERIAEFGYDFIIAELKATQQCVGILGMANIRDEVKSLISVTNQLEIGWRLDNKVWGQGLAPEGAKACLEHAWNVLKVPEVIAFTAAVNKPSRRVMEKIGMQYDPLADFEHPAVPKGHELRPHVTYRIQNPRN